MAQRAVKCGPVYHWLVHFSAILPLILALLFQGTTTVLSQAYPPIKRIIVPSDYVKEFTIPTLDAGPTGLTVDPSGNVWFMENNASKVAVFFPRNQSFKEYPFTAPQPVNPRLWSIADVALSQLAFDSKRGKLWFTWAASNSVGELDPKTDEVRLYKVPTEESGPFGILMGPDDTVWFTELFGDKIAMLDPESKRFFEFNLPSRNSGPALMTFDTEDRIWFTEAYGDRIGLLDPKLTREGTSSGIKEYSPPYQIQSPVGIAFFEGVLWLAEHGGSSFDMFLPQNNTWRQFWVSSPREVDVLESLPNQLIVGGKGTVWMAEHQGNRIARFDPSNELLTEYEVPTRPLSLTLWLALDEEGNVWFTEWATNKLGVVNTSMPLSFNISTSKTSRVLEPDGSTSLEVRAMTSSSKEMSPNYSLGGMTPFGLENITYEFSRSSQPNSMGSSFEILNIKAKTNLKPGNYTLLVSASDRVLIRSSIVTLVVKAKPYSPAGFWLLLAVGGAASVTAFLVYRRRREKS